MWRLWIILDVLKKVIAKRFGIAGDIYSDKTANKLTFYCENAIQLLRRVVKYMHHSL